MLLNVLIRISEIENVHLVSTDETHVLILTNKSGKKTSYQFSKEGEARDIYCKVRANILVAGAESRYLDLKKTLTDSSILKNRPDVEFTAIFDIMG